MINKENPARNKMGDNLNIISSPEKSIRELLLDLPICKVGLNFEGSFYISIQAMYSILKRRMNIPSYLKVKDTAYLIMENCCKHYFIDNNEIKKPLPEFLIDRFYERINKYSGRGFGVNWINTKEIIHWIQTR